MGDTNHILTWDGFQSRVLSNGWRMQTDIRPELSFLFDKIYYEPEVGNAFLIMPDNSTKKMTEEEISEVEKYCSTFGDKFDFIVYAYSEPSMLYEGEMPKSYAEQNGYKFRVNEVPEYPAAKWCGDHWERVIYIVNDDGEVIENPAGIDSHAVLGFTPQEAYEQIPDRPSVFHKWDIVNNCWKDFRSLEQAQSSCLGAIRAEFEVLRHAASSYHAYIPSYETETWMIQVLEAKAWLADNTTETPYIDTFLNTRTDEGKPSKKDLVDDIIANNNEFAIAMAKVNAKQWDFMYQIKNAKTNEDCNAVLFAVQEYCYTERAKLEA